MLASSGLNQMPRKTVNSSLWQACGTKVIAGHHALLFGKVHPGMTGHFTPCSGPNVTGHGRLAATYAPRHENNRVHKSSLREEDH